MRGTCHPEILIQENGNRGLRGDESPPISHGSRPHIWETILSQPEAISDISKEDWLLFWGMKSKLGDCMEEYQERWEMSLKTQLINRLSLNLREVLVSNDGLLSKPLEHVVKRVASTWSWEGRKGAAHSCNDGSDWNIPDWCQELDVEVGQTKSWWQLQEVWWKLSLGKGLSIRTW